MKKPVDSHEIEQNTPSINDRKANACYLAATAGGVVLVIANYENTYKALEFLGSDGQNGRQAYVDARNIQSNLVVAREHGKGTNEFQKLVGGILGNTELEDKVVKLTEKPLPDNKWLTPKQEIASPLQGIAGLIIAACGLGAIAGSWKRGRILKKNLKDQQGSISKEA